MTEWLRDGKRFACVSDGSGYEQIVVQRADGADDPKIVTTGDIGRVTELAVSPAGDVVAFANHRHELCVLDLDDGKVRVLDTSPAHRISDLAFSPDGRFLAYVWSPTRGASIIRVVKVSSGKVHDVTSPLRVDHSPAWDPEGKYLYFISTRDFNPVYDALQFDLSFPQAQRPFVVTLRSDVPSPFVPQPRPIHRDHDHDHDHDDEKKSDKPEDLRIDIDFDGIDGRVLGFPVEEGEYGQIVAVQGPRAVHALSRQGHQANARDDDEEATTGGTLSPTTSRRSASRRSRATSARFVSATTDVRWSIVRTTVCARSMRPPILAKTSTKSRRTNPGRKSGWIDLERASVEIEPRDEWAQMYREAWRLQTEQFWVEDMSDIDWDRVYDRYKAILPRVRTRTRTLRPHLGDARRTRHLARVRKRRRLSRPAAIPARLPRRGSRLGRGARRLPHRRASIAAIRGIAATIRRWPSRASTFTKAT